VAIERALVLAHKRAPGAEAVVRGATLSGIEWVVHLWLITNDRPEPREATARVRATDGEPVGFETSA
jgi:hypothetical protein